MRLWCLLILALGYPASAQISPGKLSRAHSDLSSPTKCGVCHIFGAGTPRFRCLSCHAEIRKRIADGHGYHARVVHNTQFHEDCARCHTEHYGEGFNIVKWETSKSEFDHRQTGYPLVGKHAGLACERCHSAQHIVKAERASIKVKDGNHTLLGLSPTCTTCHTDEHRGQLGEDCARCHSLDAWKPAGGFDHSKTNYPLTGLHEKVACAQCHKPRTEDAKVFVPYKDVPFASCTDCHQDPHRGSFTAPCQSCHGTGGWKLLKTTSTATFDHDKTNFPLHGAHIKTACFDCHKNGSDFKRPVAHNLCADCHSPDPHQGQFPGKDCAKCHGEDVFKPSLFTAAMHQQSDYPLTGKHAAVECAKCHIPAGKDTRYKVAFAACLDCHKDAHAGQFQDKPWANKCELCHTVDGFHPSTFTLARHQETRFQLLGGHVATACGECHKTDLEQASAAPVARYHFNSTACIDCHRDPHQGGPGTKLQQCESCHNVRSWKETAAFDHATTKFDLLGAHRSVGCLECHKPVIGRGPKLIAFKDAPSACSGCHEDVHGGQFVRDGNALDCSTCHTLVAWKPSIFDHEKQATFSLQGAHERVPCVDCHLQKATLNGRQQVVVYNKALKRCLDCHAAQ